MSSPQPFSGSPIAQCAASRQRSINALWWPVAARISHCDRILKNTSTDWSVTISSPFAPGKLFHQIYCAPCRRDVVCQYTNALSGHYAYGVSNLTSRRSRRHNEFIVLCPSHTWSGRCSNLVTLVSNRRAAWYKGWRGHAGTRSSSGALVWTVAMTRSTGGQIIRTWLTSQSLSNSSIDDRLRYRKPPRQGALVAI